MKLKDVTHVMEVGYPDGESLPVLRCLCGATWEEWRGPVIHMDIQEPEQCPACNRRFIWRMRSDVYELV